MLYETNLRHLQSQLFHPVPDYYTFYDIDQDSYAELIAVVKGEDDKLIPVHVYFINPISYGETLVDVIDSENLKTSFQIYTDGTYKKVREYPATDLVKVELHRVRLDRYEDTLIDEVSFTGPESEQEIPFLEGKEEINLEEMHWYDYQEYLNQHQS